MGDVVQGEKIEDIMKREITLGQLLTAAASIIIALATGWITMNNKVSEQSERMRALELNQQNMDYRLNSMIDRLEKKIDRSNETTTQILVELQNKQDRPK